MPKIIIHICLLIVILASSSTFALDNFHGHHAGVTEKINYDSLFNEAQPIDKSADGKRLIEECITAYGGKEHLMNLKSFHLTHQMDAYLTNQTINVDRYYSTGRKYKIVKHKEPINESRILNSNKSWFLGRDTVLILFSGKHKAELFSYLTLSMPLAMLNEPFSEIRYGKRADKPYEYIYMKKNDSLMIVTAIDPKDHFIKQVEGIIYQDSSSFIFINKLIGYKKHDEYYFPDSLINFSMGLEVAHSNLIKIEINPTIEESFFTPGKQAELK